MKARWLLSPLADRKGPLLHCPPSETLYCAHGFDQAPSWRISSPRCTTNFPSIKASWTVQSDGSEEDVPYLSRRLASIVHSLFDLKRKPWTNFLNTFECQWPVTCLLTPHEAALDKHVVSHCCPVTDCWSIADESLFPHFDWFMRSVAIMAVIVICLNSECIKPGKTELVCITCTLNMLSTK